MKIAIIGSRNLFVENLGEYIPAGVTEIVSGGAKVIDACAKQYAELNKIKITEIIPAYSRFGRNAPLIRNLEIIDYADEIIAFWDGKSRGTRFVIENAKRKRKKITVVQLQNEINLVL